MFFLTWLVVFQPTTCLASDEAECRATYSIQDNTLWVPCVDVVMLPNAVKSYTVVMQSLPDTDPLQLSVQQVLEPPVDEVTDECRATYLVDEGTFSIPCVEVLETSGNVQSYQVFLKQNAMGDPSLFVMDSLNLRLSAEEKHQVRSKVATKIKTFRINPPVAYDFCVDVKAPSNFLLLYFTAWSNNTESPEVTIELWHKITNSEELGDRIIAERIGEIDGRQRKYDFTVTTGEFYSFCFYNGDIHGYKMYGKGTIYSY